MIHEARCRGNRRRVERGRAGCAIGSRTPAAGRPVATLLAMPRQLWLLRHGDAEPHGTRPDPERRLTGRGEAQSRAAGAALAALGISFDVVFTSPRVRALETARLACEALGGEPVVHEPLSAGFSGRDGLELLAGFDEGARILAVGHEPDFSGVVRDLTGGAVQVKKGGVAGLRAGSGAGELLVLLRPRELERLARAA